MTVKNVAENEPYLWNGYWVRGPEEENVFSQQKEYKGLNIQKGDIVLDIGAHIGFSSRLFIEQGASACYAFEPIESNFVLLQKNSEGFAIYPTQAAIVSDNSPSLTLWTPNTRFSTEHSIVQKRGRTPTVVPAANFWNVLNAVKPTVLKMDIEGTELTLLEYFARIHEMPVRSIAMEVHYFQTDSREKASELAKILEEHYQPIKPLKYLDGGWNYCTGIWERK